MIPRALGLKEITEPFRQKKIKINDVGENVFVLMAAWLYLDNLVISLVPYLLETRADKTWPLDAAMKDVMSL